MELNVPIFWTYTLKVLLGVEDERLVQKLWQRYPKNAALGFLLRRCESPSLALEVTQQRIRQLASLLSPAQLIDTAESLTPRGRPRPKALTDLQERILGLLDHEGHWKWHD